MRKPKLIDDWKKAYRFFSVQASALSSLALVGWVALPAQQQKDLLAAIGMDTPAYTALAAFVVVILGRVVAQPSTDDTEA